MFEDFSKARILVLGDLLVDKYIAGKITKMSFEAPIPLVEVSSTELKLGGAGLIIENTVSLRAKAYPIGVIGSDEAGAWMKKEFKKLGVSTEGIVVDRSFRTPLRTRVTVEKHHVSRFDDSPQKLSSNITKKIIQNFKRLLPKVNCVVVCDYGMGTLVNDIIKSLIEIARKTSKIIIVSPVENHLEYKSASFIYRIKLKDAFKILDIKSDEYTIEEIFAKLHALLKSEKIILTKGEDGLSTYENGEMEDITPTHHIARDITTVGEVLVSTFAVAYSSGESFSKSCTIGNAAAGVVVEKFGSKNITREELERSLNNYYDYMMQK